jgi:hypothetical protein
MLPQEEKTIHQWRARRRTGAVDPFGADAYNAGDVVFEFRHYSSDDVLSDHLAGDGRERTDAGLRRRHLPL